MTANEGAPYDAVVLAGGGAARLGGADKPGVRVGGRALIDRVLAACSGAGTTVVVAEPRPTARPVVWAREEPQGGGPLAALDAGLRHTAAELVVVLSADLPFLDERTVRRLLAALRDSGADGAVLTDPDGRDQPLVAAYRSASLRREIRAIRALPEASESRQASESREVPESREVTEAGSGLAGRPLRLLTARLVLTRVDDPVAAFDCDTWDDIAAARARIREHGHVLDEWISAVKDELGIELDVDTGTLLDLARDAAHGVARPAAPLTTFLVGYAAAQAAARGGTAGGPEAVAEAARKAAALAARWADEDRPDAMPGAAQAEAATGAHPQPASGAAPEALPHATPHATPSTDPDAG
ncbi:MULTISPECIES: NTP transferase domain-containing protein [unclassified Streptomyces]|uniref:NTP transferase domain-containing protein n=1 Tax=unclassified Streptomyces TaxID=2593676 RepID=UPI001CBFC215|nr:MULTISPECIES: NTP transferase domain-containing protein [unclassified Streptomyces]WPO72569.1 NTP transferase domain-containing protein [Streptomyces sp. KN37]